MSATGWDQILDKGEKILWQGHPDTSIHFKPANIVPMIFGGIFAGFAVFWMVMAASAGGFFWMFGLLHFAAGLLLAVGPLLWAPYKRAHTWYTLTNRRAIISTDLPLLGRRLKSYPIRDTTVLDFSPGRGEDDLSTIHFSEEVRRGSKGRRYTVQIGFEPIRDGDRVYRLMRDIQRDDRRLREG